MKSKILFASVAYDKYDPDCTLPSKFDRMIDKMGLEERVKGKKTAIKMHLGRDIGFTTIHPLFVKKLVDKLKSYGANVFITDQEIAGAKNRGYTEDLLGCPIVHTCGLFGKYYYEKNVDFKKLQNVDVAGHIYDCEFMIDLSHVKGHGSCGFGGACKNIAMGCVTDRTRHQIHGLEGWVVWDEDLCTNCEQCVKSCARQACTFKEGKFEIFSHHCTFCQHCVKVCPTGAVKMDTSNFEDFQKGMAITTKEVIDCIGKENVYYINFLTNITALCDCWGLSTPSLVPDIGIMSSDDIVAIERASMDSVKLENLLPNSIPEGMKLGDSGTLFERLHGKDPFIQLRELEKVGLGTQEYEIEEVK